MGLDRQSTPVRVGMMVVAGEVVDARMKDRVHRNVRRHADEKRTELRAGVRARHPDCPQHVERVLAARTMQAIGERLQVVGRLISQLEVAAVMERSAEPHGGWMRSGRGLERSV